MRALHPWDQKEANDFYRTELKIFLANIKDLELNIVMGEHSEPREKWYNIMIIGNIAYTVCEYDFIINPSDPHSAPGNGNDFERFFSFNANVGSSSGILLTK